ncbi:MAG: (2Fe-2S)-binding protein [Nitrososphaerota archaeon]|nr:(2Fe-2S)-binding protein [Nitrososphaerota archaeon]
MRECVVKVNGQIRRESIKDNELLLDFLRDKLEVRSVKAACWRGECGLCTVLLNGRLVKSCLVLAVEADGGDVKTVEGISEKGELAPIQKAFIEHGASQCGFCTPAFVLASHELLKRNPNPTEADIEDAVSGLLCRCGTYAQTKEAIASLSRGAPGVKAIQVDRRTSRD